MGATVNNESTKQQNYRLRTDSSLSLGGGGGGGVKCILLVLNPSFDSAVVEAQNFKLACRLPNSCNEARAMKSILA